MKSPKKSGARPKKSPKETTMHVVNYDDPVIPDDQLKLSATVRIHFRF